MVQSTNQCGFLPVPGPTGLARWCCFILVSVLCVVHAGVVSEVQESLMGPAVLNRTYSQADIPIFVRAGAALPTKTMARLSSAEIFLITVHAAGMCDITMYRPLLQQHRLHRSFGSSTRTSPPSVSPRKDCYMRTTASQQR